MTLVFSFAMPFLVVCCAVPLAAALARRVGLVDKPDARRKLHVKVVPLVGGVAVALAVTIAVALHNYFGVATLWLANPLVLGGVGLVFLVGLADDRLRIRGKYKLLGQVAAACLLVAGGVHIGHVDVFGTNIAVGWIGVPLTIFWLVGASNSVNLLDGMDGMVGTIGLTMLIGLAGLFIARGHPVGTVVALSGAGALAGFLLFNLPPAKIFMGDAGSLTLGMVLGVLALKVEGGDGPFALGPAGVSLFFLPIADSCAAFTRRLLTGRSIFATDRGHLHHRLIQLGYSPRGVLRLVLGLNLLLAAGVVGRELASSGAPVVVSVGLVALILVLGRLFGHTELMLLARRGGSRLPIPDAPRRALGRAVRVHIQGSCLVWDETWALVRAQTVALKARCLCLNISAPAMHETYLARWDAPAERDSEAGQWRADWPVRHNGQVIGWLTVVAEPCKDASPKAMLAVSDLVAEIERTIDRAMDETSGVLPVPASKSWVRGWRDESALRGSLAPVGRARGA